jgi:hypothetical protein
MSLIEVCGSGKQELRKQLDLLLDRKVKDPTFDIHVQGKGVVNAVLELLHTDGRDDDWQDSAWGPDQSYSRR